MTSEYDQLVKEARIRKVGHENMASSYIPKAYRILVEQGLKPLDAGDKIRDDFRGCWEPSTIKKLLPPEAKHQEHGNPSIKDELDPDDEAEQKVPLVVENGGSEEIDPEKVRIMITSRDQEIETWKNRAKGFETALNEIQCNINSQPIVKELNSELARAKETISELSAVKDGGFITADKINTEHEARINIQDYFNQLRTFFVNREQWVYLKISGTGVVTEIYGERERK